ncbi:hypothetical protein V1289_002796 [Bradyrhizobium sp. AZCC 2289]
MEGLRRRRGAFNSNSRDTASRRRYPDLSVSVQTPSAVFAIVEIAVAITVHSVDEGCSLL